MDAGAPPLLPPSGKVLQAEDTTLVGARVVTGGHLGAVGDKFVDYRGYNNSVTWSGLNFPAGTYKVKVRYGNYSHRRSRLIVNGAEKAIIQFRYNTSQAPMSWAEWVYETSAEFSVSGNITSIKIDPSIGV